MLENLSILSKLEINPDDEKLKKDMAAMIEYVSKINEADTEGVEPMSHVHQMYNVYREDEVLNASADEELFKNAPELSGEYVKVPKTI